MGKESSSVPCINNPSRACDCPFVSITAKYLNLLGNEDTDIRRAIQQQGYDRVSVGLITELLRHPYGGFYTDAFETKYPFSEDMRDIRQKIIDTWKKESTLLAEKHPEYMCSEKQDTKLGD